MKAPPKTTKSAAAAPAVGKKVKKSPLPVAAKKLVGHRSTRHLWAKIKRTAAKKKVAPESLLKKKPQFVVKKIGGDKNGGTRKVYTKKATKYYPTEPLQKKRKTGKIPFKAHKRTLKEGKFTRIFGFC